MNPVAFLKLMKIKHSGSLRLALEHDTRDRIPSYAYPEKTHLNIVERSTEEAMRLYETLLPEKVRKNAVHAVEFVVQASYSAMKIDHKAFFTISTAWLSAKLGGENNRLNSAMHFDEETPHLHVLIMPLREGKLNYASYLGGGKFQLQELQTDFACEVASRFGLERGIERSGISHHHHAAYRQQMEKPLEDLPVVKLPDPKPWKRDIQGYGEEIAQIYKKAYEPLVTRLEAVTNKVENLERYKHDLMKVNSGRAKEYDELHAAFERINKMILENDERLIKYREKLLQKAALENKQNEKKPTQDKKKKSTEQDLER